MGLDSVELVMEVERTFGVQIYDNEWIEINTVDNFVTVMNRHITFYPDSTCCCSDR